MKIKYNTAPTAAC